MINQRGLGELQFCYPADVDLQRRLVARIEALTARLAEIRRLQTENDTELTAFTPDLLAKAFRGGL